jgi:predicted HicB family RNase H-like nuclease
MVQVTWRESEELVERVQGAARRQGRSMNDYITAVLDVATDPNLAGSDADRLTGC